MDKLFFGRHISKKQFYAIFTSYFLIFIAMICALFMRKSLVSLSASNQIQKEVIYEGEDQYSISLKKSSSLNTEEGYGEIYTITITSENDEPIEGWDISLDIPDNAELNQYWCGDFEVQEDTLNISSLDYNSTINKDYPASCGFILNSPSEVAMEDISIKFNGKAYSVASDMRLE